MACSLRHEHFCAAFRALDKASQVLQREQQISCGLPTTPSSIAHGPTIVPSLSPAYSVRSSNSVTTIKRNSAVPHFSFNIDGETKALKAESIAADSNANMLLLCAAAAVGAAREDISVKRPSPKQRSRAPEEVLSAERPKAISEGDRVLFCWSDQQWYGAQVLGPWYGKHGKPKAKATKPKRKTWWRVIFDDFTKLVVDMSEGNWGTQWRHSSSGILPSTSSAPSAHTQTKKKRKRSGNECIDHGNKNTHMPGRIRSRARAKIAAFVRDRHQQNDDGFPSYAYVHLRKRPRDKTGTSSSSKQEEFVKDFLRPHASQNKQAPLQAPLQATLQLQALPMQALPLQAPLQTQQCVPQTADCHQVQLHALQTQLARAEATRARVLSESVLHVHT